MRSTSSLFQLSQVLQTICIALVICVIAIVSRSQAASIDDDFDYADNTALEAVWGAPAVGGATATSFTYNTGSGTLNATGLSDSNVGGYGTAILSRPVSHSGDFLASMDFNWNQSAVLGVMFLELRSATGVIASGGLGDDTGNPGHAYMQVGGNTTYLGANGAFIGGGTFESQSGAIATVFDNAPIVSAAADAVRIGLGLGDTGSATLEIERVGDQISLLVDDGTNQFALGPITGSTDDIASINLIFAGFAYGGPANHLVGDAGTHIAVDRISLAVPEPGSVVICGCTGLLLSVLVRRRISRR